MNQLDDAALVKLTGYRQPSKQVAWVRKNLGLEPMVGADGRPRLTPDIIEKAALARRVGATQPGAPGVASKGPQPAWRRAA